MLIQIYTDIQIMTGVGEEWLVKGDTIIAIFTDGWLKSDLPSGNTQITEGGT